MRRYIVFLMAGVFFLACGGKKTENKAPEKIADENTLFEQAQSFEKSQEFAKASELYQSLIDNYPSSPNRYKALFMLGYLQLEYLKDANKAAIAFETLLKEYPTCDLADDAKIIHAAAVSGRDLDSIFQDSLMTK